MGKAIIVSASTGSFLANILNLEKPATIICIPPMSIYKGCTIKLIFIMAPFSMAFECLSNWLRSSTSYFIVTINTRILLAVPKKKVTLSRKRKRAAVKGLELKQNIDICNICGGAKLSHTICTSRLKAINR